MEVLARHVPRVDPRQPRRHGLFHLPGWLGGRPRDVASQDSTQREHGVHGLQQQVTAMRTRLSTENETHAHPRSYGRGWSGWRRPGRAAVTRELTPASCEWLQRGWREY